MAENSKIEWTDHTFNIAEGCQKISPACANCYAERRDKQYHDGAHWGPNTRRKMMSESYWRQPLKWNALAQAEGRRYRVFSSSLADVFENHPDLLLPRLRLFDLLRRTPNLDWLLLTKRPGNVLSLTVASGRIVQADDESYDDTLFMLANFVKGVPIPNVWLGTTAENQEYADQRIPKLLQLPAKVRFLSCEPLLGAVDLGAIRNPAGGYFDSLYCGEDGHRPTAKIDWVIAGGESGPNARPSHPEWFRLLREQCKLASVPFFFKQWGEFAPAKIWGEWPENAFAFSVDGQRSDRYDGKAYQMAMMHLGKKAAGRLLDGRTWDEMPEVRQ